jgi:hypothetical protein
MKNTNNPEAWRGTREKGKNEEGEVQRERIRRESVL